MTAILTPTRRIRARCPRDGSRLLLEQDAQGTYLSCLCCGSVLDEQVRAHPDPRPLPIWWRDQPAHLVHETASRTPRPAQAPPRDS